MSEFPANIVEALMPALVNVGGSATALSVVNRVVRPMSDPNGTLGIVAFDWTPTKEFEIGAAAVAEPLFQNYRVSLQLLQKYVDEAQGRDAHSRLSKSIRLMVYRNSPLIVALHQLSESAQGKIERLKKWGVTRQRFHVDNFKGQFLFVSATEITFQTETS